MKDYQVIQAAHQRLMELGENTESFMMRHLLAIGKRLDGFQKTSVPLDFDSTSKAIRENDIIAGRSVRYCEERK